MKKIKQSPKVHDLQWFDSSFIQHNWLTDEKPMKDRISDYFNDVSYNINLSDIYNIIGSCYINDDMPYCPILIQLSQDKIIQAYEGCKYLLQVWNAKQKTKIYEKPLQNKIKVWTIAYQHLVYQLEGQDEKSLIYIVKIDEENGIKSMIVKNFALNIEVNHLSLIGNILYAASDYEIHTVYLENICDSDNEVVNVLMPQFKIREIKTDLKVIALVVNGLANNNKFQPVAFESIDNQIDYVKLLVNEINDDEKYSYSFEYQRENQPRKQQINDPIIKFSYVYYQGYMFGVILRKSGGFDFYWNFIRSENSENIRLIDVSMSLTTFYLKDVTGQIYSLEHQQRSAFQFQEAKIETQNQALNFDQTFHKIITHFVKPYVGMNILRTNITGTIIVLAHGKFISIYDIENQRWRQHCQYEDDISMLFRHYKKSNDKFQSVILKNGAIYIGVINNELLIDMIPIDLRSQKIDGQLIQVTNDIENHQALYMLIKHNDKYHIDVLVRGVIQRLQAIDEAQIDHSCQIVPIQTMSEETNILIKGKDFIKVYKQHINNGIDLKEVYSIDDQNLQLKNNLKISCSFDLQNHIFVFDDKNMYIIKLNQKSSIITKFEKIYCVGVQRVSDSINYALFQYGTGSQYEGLYNFDIEQIVKNEKVSFQLLKKFEPGLMNIENGVTIDRLGFLNSFTNILITPELHKNVIRFMGFKQFKDYSLMNIIDDRFYALSGQTIETYDVFNGKLISQYQIDKENLDISKLQYADRKNIGKIMFVSKDNVSLDNEEDYHLPWQMKTQIQNAKTFEQAQQKSIKTYYYLEILGPTQVKIHLQFNHPYYSYQRVFINDNHDKMITVLLNYRTFIYSVEKLNISNKQLVKMKPICPIIPYPSEMDNNPKFLEHFSPCFNQFISFNFSNKQYVIKDTLSGDIIQHIPTHILKSDDEVSHIKWATNRIKWLNSYTLKIVNEEGIEQIYNIHNFDSTAYNVVPLFNEIQEREWETHHYYLKRSILQSVKIIERLKRKYQSYKSNQFMNQYFRQNDQLKVISSVDNTNTQSLEQSFSYMNWVLIEQISSGQLKIEDISPNVLESMIYTILPNGQTLLHLLASQKQELLKLLRICHQNDKIIYHLPFLPDFSNRTPLHLLLEANDIHSINEILKYLGLYHIDHHSRFIDELYPVFMKYDLPNFIPYLRQRFQQAQQLQQVNYGVLVDQKNVIMPYSQALSGEVKNNNLEVFDIGGIYHYLHPQFSNFIQCLANTNRSEYFNEKALRILLDLNYPIVQKYFLNLIAIPFFMMHLLFVFYTNLVHENRKVSKEYENANWVISIVLLTFAAYFVTLEFIQMKFKGIEYMWSIWNYINILAPIGIIVFQTLQFIDFDSKPINIDFYRSILALTTFFMWFKILYVLRVFKRIGYFIRVISEIVNDMQLFLFILFLSVFAFGDSFLRLSYGNHAQDKQFIQHFFYGFIFGWRMILGEFDTEHFGQVSVPLVYIFFFLCTLFDTIVLLNLVITIISETYKRVFQNVENASYREMAFLIAENSYLIPQSAMKSYVPQGQLLLTLKNQELTEISGQQQDPLSEQVISELQDKNKNLTKLVQDQIVNQQIFQKEILEKITSLKQDELHTEALKLIGTEVFVTKVHNHSLVKKQLRQISYNAFSCDARVLQGCQNATQPDSIDYNLDKKKTLYHCFTCGFDYCTECYDTYGGKTHQHELSKINFESIYQLPKYQNNGGWLCDARFYKPCSYGLDKTWRNLDDITYHCSDCQYDICDKCIQIYKA